MGRFTEHRDYVRRKHQEFIQKQYRKSTTIEMYRPKTKPAKQKERSFIKRWFEKIKGLIKTT